MSDLEVESARQEMEASGELDFIRQHSAAATDTAPVGTPADTVTDEPVVEEVEEEPVVEEEAAEEAAPLTAEEEEVLYLELDDATQTLIDTKYGGDISKALSALTESQSLIGRQGNELGDLRRAMEEMEARISQSLVQAQPYPEWPEEYADPQEAAMAYRAIAEQAFAREDIDMFGSAVDAWMEADPVSANTYRDLKILQLQTSARTPMTEPVQATPDSEVIQAGVAKLQEEFPDMLTPEFGVLMNEELQKFPTLKGLLWGEIPGTTPEQRVSALRETVTRISSRQNAETEESARRKVAVRRSEAARQARVEAKVASGESARIAEPEPVKREVPMGTSGRTLDIDRLNAMLSPEDRI